MRKVGLPRRCTGNSRVTGFPAVFFGAILVFLAGCPLSPPPPVASVGVQLVAEGMTSPVAMAVPPDASGRRFIVDQTGLIRILNAEGQLLSEPFLDLTDRLVQLMPAYDERGLLGLAFHPDYATNGRFYVFYTAPKGPEAPTDFDSETHISEFQVSADNVDRAEPGSERILLTIAKPQFNHNGGALQFGSDGFLYLSTGDGGGANDVDVGHTPDLGNGQDTSKLLGKILRIDVDTGDPYGIPSSNPFVDKSGVRPEIWAFGLRNPYRFSFDMAGSRRLFVGDVGQDLFEEVDIVQVGENLGWHIREGLHCFDPDNPGNPPATCPHVDAAGRPLTSPIIEYPHDDATGNPVGIAVIGGFVYRGSAIPGLVGDYVFGDLSRSFSSSDGSVFAATENIDGTWTRSELTIAGAADGRLGRFVLGFGQDADGEVYVLTTHNLGPTGSTGEVFKLVSAP